MSESDLHSSLKTITISGAPHVTATGRQWQWQRGRAAVALALAALAWPEYWHSDLVDSRRIRRDSLARPSRSLSLRLGRRGHDPISASEFTHWQAASATAVARQF
jgi:hypothetical protein